MFQIFTEERVSFNMWFFPPWQGAVASKGPQDPWLQVEVLPSKQSMASPRMQQFVLFMFFTVETLLNVSTSLYIIGHFAARRPLSKLLVLLLARPLGSVSVASSAV